MGPQCIWCEAQPVTRDYHRQRTVEGLGARIVDGKRWHWFCSRPCQTAHAGSQQTPTGIYKAVEKRRQAHQRRLVGQVVAACKGLAGPDGRLAPVDVAKLLMRERRTAYYRGYNACMQRMRRGQAA